MSQNVAKAWVGFVLFVHFGTIAAHAGLTPFVVIAVIVAVHYRWHHP